MTVQQLRFIALRMHITKHLLNHGFLCAVGIHELHLKKRLHLLLRHGYVRWVSHQRRGYSMPASPAAAPARREAVLCYVMLRLLLQLLCIQER